MEILFIVIFNVIAVVLIYIALHVKMDRQVKRLFERKMKSEMDSLITEFNSVADRNISLLEKRIKTLKYLMEESGNIKGIDVLIGEEKKEWRPDPETVQAKQEEVKPVEGAGTPEGSIGLTSMVDAVVNQIRELFINRFPRRKGGARGSVIDMVSQDYPIEKEIDGRGFSDKDDFDIKKRNEINNDLSILHGSSNLHGDIFSLYQKGYDISLLARETGLSEGEISLVINLYTGR
jgi:hypothetical protein